MDLYRELILDHFKHPRNFGHLNDPDVTHEEYNTTCGDRIRMEIKLKRRKTKVSIADVKFSGDGCAISQASASLLTERIKGMATGTVMKFTPKNVYDMLEVTLTPSRVKCALLPLEVIQKAVTKNRKGA